MKNIDMTEYPYCFLQYYVATETATALEHLFESIYGFTQAFSSAGYCGHEYAYEDHHTTSSIIEWFESQGLITETLDEWERVKKFWFNGLIFHASSMT